MNFPAGSIESLIVNEERFNLIGNTVVPNIVDRMLKISYNEAVEKILFHLNGEVISPFTLMSALGGVLGFPVRMTKEQDSKNVQFGVEYPTYLKWLYKHNGTKKVAILRAGDDIELCSFGKSVMGKIRAYGRITHEIVLLEIGR